MPRTKAVWTCRHCGRRGGHLKGCTRPRPKKPAHYKPRPRNVGLPPRRLPDGRWEAHCVRCLAPIVLEFEPRTNKVCDSCYAPRGADETDRPLFGAAAAARDAEGGAE